MASNSLEVVLKLKDQFTAGMASATSTLNRSVKSASISAKAFNSAFKEGERITKALRTPTEIYNDQVKRLTQLLNLGAVSQNTFNRGIAKARSELDTANGALNRQNTIVGKGKNGIASLTTAYRLFGAYVGVRTVNDLYNTATALEGMRMKMNAAIPSLHGGQIEMAFIRKEANRMGLDLRKTTEEYAAFSAASLRSNISLKDTRQIFTDINEAAISMRLSNEKISYVMQALTQIASKGKVSMEELRLQLGDHLPGAVNIAAKAMGMTSAAFQKAVSDGKVMAEDFLPNFAEQIRKELGGSFEDASNSVVANVNRMNNALFELKAQAGKLFTSNFFSGLVNQFAEGLQAINLMMDKKSGADNVIGVIQSMWGDPEAQKRVLEGYQKAQQAHINKLKDQLTTTKHVYEGMMKSSSLLGSSPGFGRERNTAEKARKDIEELTKQLENANEELVKYNNAINGLSGVLNPNNKNNGGGGSGLSDKAQKDFIKGVQEWGYKDAQVRFEAQQKAEKQLVESARKWATEDAKARIDAKKLYNEQVLSSERLLQETQISMIADNYSKELALLDLKYQEIRLKHANNADALFNIDRSYEIEKGKLQKEQGKQGLSIITGNLQELTGQWRGFMRAYQVMTAAQAMMDAYSASNASYKAMAGIPYVGPVLGAVAAAAAIGAGIAKVASIKSVKFAKGTSDFITNGPMMMMVGDNRGGRERVNVQPLSSPNVNGPSGGTPTVFNFYDRSGTLVDSIRRDIRSGTADNLIQDLFNRHGYLK